MDSRIGWCSRAHFHQEGEGEREGMEKENQNEPNTMIDGQATIWLYAYRAMETMALMCAVELRIADIIHSHGHPTTLSQIANGIGSPSLDLSTLARVMKFLAHMKLFDASSESEGCEETLYGLTPSSKLLLHDAELSLVPFVSITNPISMMSRMSFLGQCVKEGGTAFRKAHGYEFWEFASLHPEFNMRLNSYMESTAKISTKAMLTEYRDGFDAINGSLVDVGGSSGFAMAEIVKAHPHIKGTNFDLPHVVATAPAYSGVTHVGGDMFESIPHADAILMARIMHNWSDEDCIKILQNCRKALPEKTGKVLILDVVLQPAGDGLYDKVGMISDMVMLVNFSGGKERTELEWKKVLEGGGFPRYKIINIHAVESIIEAYPE